jgi:hypothetical protein
MTTDPVNLGHRVYVTTDDGYCAACICGWRVTRHPRTTRPSHQSTPDPAVTMSTKPCEMCDATFEARPRQRFVRFAVPRNTGRR